MDYENILIWNVHGLNARSHCDAVWELVAAKRPSLVCLQEMKLSVISDFDAIQIIGSGFDYAYLPAEGVRGGILVAWRTLIWSVACVRPTTFSISVCIKLISDNSEMWLTTVYGPSRDSEEPAGPWLLLGDFNLIYRAEDNNNDRLDRRLMGQFCQFLSQAALKELHLTSGLYTWSNERVHLTLERIDRVFISTEWHLQFPDNDLHPVSSINSDHAPLLLRTDNSFYYKKRFHFRSIRTKFPGFLQVVRRAWHCPLHNADPFRRLDWLLRNTARVLRSWSSRFVGSVCMQLEMAKEIIRQLELVGDRRNLSAHEDALRRRLKLKALGLSSLQCSIARQESRLLWLVEGDAPTKFFHLHSSTRARRKYIKSFEREDGTLAFSKDEKADLTYSYFDEILGMPPSVSAIIDLNCIGVPSTDLRSLGNQFTEAEIWSTIAELHPDKAPGPDGSTAKFFQYA